MKPPRRASDAWQRAPARWRRPIPETHPAHRQIAPSIHSTDDFINYRPHGSYIDPIVANQSPQRLTVTLSIHAPKHDRCSTVYSGRVISKIYTESPFDCLLAAGQSNEPAKMHKIDVHPGERNTREFPYEELRVEATAR